MIHAIQQVGLGVIDKQYTLDWFARLLDFRTIIFDDENEAPFMTKYTGGDVCKRSAALVFNSHGGAGLEIWQHTSRKPLLLPENISLRSLGFLICKIRCRGIFALVERLQQDTEPSLQIIGKIGMRPTGEYSCYFTVFEAWFELVEGKQDFFQDTGESFCAGVLGVTVGVSNMENALQFYRYVLGYDHVVQDQEDDWEDWKGFAAMNIENSGKYRRVLLQREVPETGLYAELFGVGEIELVEFVRNPWKEVQQTIKETLHLRKSTHLYSERYWGDPGFIHLCFDVSEMDSLADRLEQSGIYFTVDSGKDFAMGKLASGRFAYLEDPDGSLIEFVETYRIPILKKWRISLNVRKMRQKLPRWLLRFAIKDNYEID